MGTMSTMGATELTSGRQELTDLARAVAGGLLFGVPLLYTMELWWTGQRATPAQNLAVLAVTFVVMVLLQRTSGFRQSRDVRLRDAAIDAVDAMGVSLVVVTLVLVLLREITPDTPLAVALGKIVHQALAFSIGAGVAHHYLRESRDEDDDEDNGDEGDDGEVVDDDDAGAGHAGSNGINPTLADLGATAVGAVFIALNVAPTDEVPMLASALGIAWALALLVASLVISYIIVFVAGFAGERQRRDQKGILQHPMTETVVCYLVSLAAAAGMLRLFDRLDGPWTDTLTKAVILALPATIGGAAGRLAV